MKPKIEALDQYPIEVQRILDEDGGGYVATIPSLGRLLFEGTGATREEAVSNLLEYATELLQEYERRGLELPDPPRDDLLDYSGRLLLRLPKFLHRRLTKESSENRVSLNTYLVSILADSFRTPRADKTLGEIQHCLVQMQSKSPVIKHIEIDSGGRFFDNLVSQEQTYERAS